MKTEAIYVLLKQKNLLCNSEKYIHHSDDRMSTHYYFESAMNLLSLSKEKNEKENEDKIHPKIQTYEQAFYALLCNLEACSVWKKYWSLAVPLWMFYCISIYYNIP